MGDTNPVRHTPYASWADDLAHLEGMRGARWRAAVRAEQTAYAAVARMPAVERRVAAGRRILEAGRAAIQQFVFRAGGGRICLAPENSAAWLWKYADEPADAPTKSCEDLLADQTHIWTVRDIGSGAEILELQCATHDGKVCWRRRGVGPGIAIREGCVYYTLVENIHRSYAVERACAYTGERRTKVLVVRDPRVNLRVIRGEGGACFIQGEDSGSYKLWTYDGKVLDHESKVQVPAGESSWLADGRPAGAVKDWAAPPAKESILWALPGRGWLATYMYGITRIYKWNARTCKCVYTLRTGRILLDTWTAWETPAGELYALELSPAGGVRTLLLGDGGVSVQAAQPATTTHSLIAKTGWAVSEDDTRVPYRLIGMPAALRKPRGLLVYGYGAYGLPTTIGTLWNLWGPLLDAGWVVAYAFVRGGGDGGDAWADAGRRTGRLKAVEDFEAVVRVARSRLGGVPAARTVIAGRSAGGLLVGAAVGRNGGGDLMGGAFAEVPYVDVLRTTTNPALPLTTIEYNEFGQPTRRVEDFAAVQAVSPIDLVAGRGAPGVFVLARTGGHDTQVYPYEPVKWMRRLRSGQGAQQEGKLLGYDADQGHFYSPAADLDARATDLAILDAWVDSPVVRKKIADISINKMAENMMRKSRKNNMRKSRKAEGGRRRKARRATTRKARKTRRVRRH